MLADNSGSPVYLCGSRPCLRNPSLARARPSKTDVRCRCRMQCCWAPWAERGAICDIPPGQPACEILRQPAPRLRRGASPTKAHETTALATPPFGTPSRFHSCLPERTIDGRFCQGSCVDHMERSHRGMARIFGDALFWAPLKLKLELKLRHGPAQAQTKRDAHNCSRLITRCRTRIAPSGRRFRP
jgi:hypothetical protein